MLALFNNYFQTFLSSHFICEETKVKGNETTYRHNTIIRTSTVSSGSRDHTFDGHTYIVLSSECDQGHLKWISQHFNSFIHKIGEVMLTEFQLMCQVSYDVIHPSIICSEDQSSNVYMRKLAQIHFVALRSQRM